MEPMSPEEEKQRGLTRERLVESALSLVNEEGLDGLSMRALADRLEVKAASLYWHVRDRRELLDMVAESLLDSVRTPRRTAGWRANVLAMAAALGRVVSATKDADRILLEVPEAVRRSELFHDLVTQFQSAGLQPVEATDAALMVTTYVIAGRTPTTDEDEGAGASGEVASIAVDTGSRGVILRAGAADMQGLIRVPPDQGGAAPAVVRGEQVVVRRLRGVGRGEIELNPRRPWKFKIQAPTFNTVLDLPGIDVREIWIDSGAANVECFLPAPRGVVPLHISSGVVNVAIHRERGAAVIAQVHPGAWKLKLDDYSTNVAVLDVHWQSEGALGARDRYDLDVSSGVVDFKLDSYVAKVARTATAPSERPSRSPRSEPASAVEILLDGIDARVKGRS